MLRWLAALIAALTLTVGAVAQDVPDGLYVDAAAPIGTINPHVYGANYGPWNLVSMDMGAAAAASGVTHLRFPAGRWGDQFDITEGQLDLFMLQARAWGADVSISVRLEGGTPEQAAELVRYANIEKGYAIRHWSIGNEPDIFVEYTPERFNAEWRAIALAMEAVDPDILLIGPEVSQFPPTVSGTDYTNVRREWVRAFLEANGDLVDIVAIHRYPFPETNSSPPTTIEQLRANAPQWEVLVENLRVVMRETLGRELPIGLTELNSHWNHVIGGEATPDSRYHAVWWADVLGRLIRARVDLVNYFALSSSGALGTFGLLDRYDERPTYYVYQLYKQFGEELLPSSSSDLDVTVTAARRADGALTLMIVNRGPERLAHPLTVNGAADAAVAEAWVLDATRDAEAIAVAEVFDTGVVMLPPQSVLLLVLRAS